MKKIAIFVFLCLLFLMPIHANTRESVSFKKCTDGDTAHFMVDGVDTTVRFLAIDTPEYTKEKEPYGKEASAFTCNAIEHAETIELEYDDASDKVDKYGRVLAWVYVDGKLLQQELIANGLAEVAYLYGDYTYTDALQEAQLQAQKQALNIWSDEEATEAFAPWKVIALSMCGIVLSCFSIFQVKGKRKKKLLVKAAMREIKKKR